MVLGNQFRHRRWQRHVPILESAVAVLVRVEDLFAAGRHLDVGVREFIFKNRKRRNSLAADRIKTSSANRWRTQGKERNISKKYHSTF
jgi:hypothetical protein